MLYNRSNKNSIELAKKKKTRYIDQGTEDPEISPDGDSHLIFN
jgi:hypothetical protein